MSSKLRALAAALIVALIVVPVVVRATRTFDPGSRPRLAPSFNKSFDVPPDVAGVPPDAPGAPSLIAAGPAPHPAAVPVVSDVRHVVDPLRGPPASIRS
jgi:hypothetical protein